MPAALSIYSISSCKSKITGLQLNIKDVQLPAFMSPYLPENNKILRNAVQDKLMKDIPGVDFILEHVQYCQSPDNETTITSEEISRVLKIEGIQTGKNPTDNSYYCRCNKKKIFLAINTLRTSKLLNRHSDTAGKQRTKTKDAARSHPAADALDWDEALSVIKNETNAGEYRNALLVACGCFLGLRVSDILRLTWSDLTNSDTFTITEKKTGKKRTLKINGGLKQLAQHAYSKLAPDSDTELIFRHPGNDGNRSLTRQRIDQILKELKTKYNIRSAKVFSSHSLRKTFGRRVWLQECKLGRGDQALLLLCEIFGHSNAAITKRYLGIRQEELLSAYDKLTD